MKLPKLTEEKSRSEKVGQFLGYNHNLQINAAEFYDMENMTTDFYPVLSPRSKRGLYASPENAQGIISKDMLCYVDGSEIVLGVSHIEMGLSTAAADCPKKLVSFGAYLIILPDKKYINTLQPYDKGDIEAHHTTQREGAVWTTTWSLCNIEGETVTPDYISPTQPTVEVTDGETWMDTSSGTYVLRVYSSVTLTWSVVPTTYVKIGFPSVDEYFRVGDGITVKLTKYTGQTGGYKEPDEETYFDNARLDALNGAHIVRAKGDNYIVIEGIIEDEVSIQNVVTVDRSMPDMDYVIESGNRLWGCKYRNDLAPLNEIYASALGDFRNWNVFEGISTDSYVASCGTDGPWTGAVSYLGSPIFFKEKHMHRVYGDYPANFQIQDTVVRGVEDGSSESLCIVDETLFYKSRTGVCAFNGSLPQEISSAFGNERYSGAVAGSLNSKYYISMKDKNDVYHLFVYDSKKGLWMKEDKVHAMQFAAYRDNLYYIDAESGKIRTISGTGSLGERKVKWYVETGRFGLSSTPRKYISRISVRMSLAIDSIVRMYIQYDSCGQWQCVYQGRGTSLNSFYIPVRPHRCDHFRLRIEGAGDAKIFSIDKTIEEGSDF